MFFFEKTKVNRIKNGKSVAFSFVDPTSGKNTMVLGYKTENTLLNNALETFLQHESVRKIIVEFLKNHDHLEGLPLSIFKR